MAGPPIPIPIARAEERSPEWPPGTAGRGLPSALVPPCHAGAGHPPHLGPAAVRGATASAGRLPRGYRLRGGGTTRAQKRTRSTSIRLQRDAHMRGARYILSRGACVLPSRTRALRACHFISKTPASCTVSLEYQSQYSPLAPSPCHATRFVWAAPAPARGSRGCRTRAPSRWAQKPTQGQMGYDEMAHAHRARVDTRARLVTFGNVAHIPAVLPRPASGAFYQPQPPHSAPLRPPVGSARRGRADPDGHPELQPCPPSPHPEARQLRRR